MSVNTIEDALDQPGVTDSTISATEKRALDVPGTHTQLTQPPKAMADPAGHHPDELIVTAPAGSVLVFNGHLWHSGTRNNSRHSRRALQCVFWARENFPPYAQPLCDEPESLSSAVRYILGV